MESRLCLCLWFAYPHRPAPMTKAANVATEAKDLVIIGGGVAGYVAAIKAGQEGLKVSSTTATGPPGCAFSFG